MFNVPNQYRIKNGAMGSNSSIGNNGAFILPITDRKTNCKMIAIASDQAGWEHVSVSFNKRCPTWEEMCKVKDMFWGENDVVIQLHPPKKDYVNNHPYCLHLWRKAGTNEYTELPPKKMVGV